MLPFFAILLFALIGIGALVIDGGLALTEQARLETAAEMLVTEWAYVQNLPDAQLPAACVTAGVRNDECLEVAYLTPLVTPLGVDLANQGAGTAPWRRADAALDGRRVDPRGARLGALDVNGVLGAGTPGEIRLERSSPLLFGWGAIQAQTEGGTRIGNTTRRAAQTAQGLAPDLAGRGVYGEGFSLSASARLALLPAPAVQVGGARVRDANGNPAAGGLVGVAWRLAERAALDASLYPGGGAPTSINLTRDGRRLENGDGDIVACLFDPDASGSHVGQPIDLSAPAPSDLDDVVWPSAYVPVVVADSTCAPSPGTAPNVLGFVELGIFPGAGVDQIRIERGAGLRRNALAYPRPNAATAALATLRGREVDELEGTGVWTNAAVRVPRVEQTTYDERRVAAQTGAAP